MACCSYYEGLKMLEIININSVVNLMSNFFVLNFVKVMITCVFITCIQSWRHFHKACILDFLLSSPVFELFKKK